VKLSDTSIRALKPKAQRYERADERGLFIEVLPSAEKTWRYRYRLNGRREKVTIGPYPEVSLSDARKRRFEFAQMVERGESPARTKQRQKTAARTARTVRELGQAFCAEIVDKKYRRPVDAKRYFTRDIYPAIGSILVKDVMPEDVLTVIERIMHRGSDRAARTARGLLKRMFDYAIHRRAVLSNPVAEVAPAVTGKASERQRTLSTIELREFLTALDKAEDTPTLKVALNLILLTMVRKGELTHARWEHVNLDAAEWLVPAENSKTSQPHTVYLSSQALALFRELKNLAGDAQWVLPGRDGRKPISAHTLNVMLYRHNNFGLKSFVIHDLRRTASTLLHEAGFQSDVIEKALNHTIKGVRGVYNRAEYADQRRKMLQWWADHVDAVQSGAKVVIGRFGRAA